MSASPGTIQGTQSGISWAGAKVAAILLAVVMAVTLFAMTRSTSATGTKPVATTFQVGDQLSGGKNLGGTTSDSLPARQPITIGSYVCHQCR